MNHDCMQWLAYDKKRYNEVYCRVCERARQLNLKPETVASIWQARVIRTHKKQRGRTWKGNPVLSKFLDLVKFGWTTPDN